MHISFEDSAATTPEAVARTAALTTMQTMQQCSGQPHQSPYAALCTGVQPSMNAVVTRHNNHLFVPRPCKQYRGILSCGPWPALPPTRLIVLLIRQPTQRIGDLRPLPGAQASRAPSATVATSIWRAIVATAADGADSSCVMTGALGLPVRLLGVGLLPFPLSSGLADVPAYGTDPVRLHACRAVQAVPRRPRSTQDEHCKGQTAPVQALTRMHCQARAAWQRAPYAAACCVVQQRRHATQSHRATTGAATCSLQY